MKDELEYLSQLIQANRDFRDQLMATIIKMRIRDNARHGVPIHVSMTVAGDQGNARDEEHIQALRREMLDTVDHSNRKIKDYQEAYQRLKSGRETLPYR